MPETNSVPGALREQILVAAKQLFIKQGYHGLSMREISDAVGVSKAALYYHFKDKEELFLAILDSSLDDIEHLIDQIEAQENTARQRVRFFVKAILAQPAGQRAVIRLASQEMAQLSPPMRQAFNRSYHEKFIDRIGAVLQRGIDSGELRPLDARIATWTLLGMMYPYFYPAHSAEIPSLADVAEQMLTIYLDGIGQPKD
jgi:AcrR family transcriptional regulator